MRISIADANILIDILLLSLDKQFFNLPLDICTTKSVLLELKDSQQEVLDHYFKQNLLKIDDSPINPELKFSRSLSIADQSVLSVAFSTKAILLTGDKPVRKWCHKHKIEVHGILWIFDQLLSNGIIDKENGANKLTKLMVINDRLPEEECLIRLNEWKGK